MWALSSSTHRIGGYVHGSADPAVNDHHYFVKTANPRLGCNEMRAIIRQEARASARIGFSWPPLKAAAAACRPDTPPFAARAACRRLRRASVNRRLDNIIEAMPPSCARAITPERRRGSRRERMRAS